LKSEGILYLKSTFHGISALWALSYKRDMKLFTYLVCKQRWSPERLWSVCLHDEWAYSRVL